MSGRIIITLQEEGNSKYKIEIPAEVSQLIQEYIDTFNMEQPTFAFSGKFDLFLRTIWDRFLKEIIKENTQVIANETTNPDLYQIILQRSQVEEQLANLEKLRESLMILNSLKPNIVVE